jgi:hypothetical protein
MGSLIALVDDNTFHISTSSLSLIMKHDSFVELIQHKIRGQDKMFHLNVSRFLCNNSISIPILNTIGQTENLEKCVRGKHLGSGIPHESILTQNSHGIPMNDSKILT